MWQKLGLILKFGSQVLLILQVIGLCVPPVTSSAVSLPPRKPDTIPPLFFYFGGWGVSTTTSFLCLMSGLPLPHKFSISTRHILQMQLGTNHRMFVPTQQRVPGWPDCTFHTHSSCSPRRGQLGTHSHILTSSHPHVHAAHNIAVTVLPNRPGLRDQG